MSKDYSGVGRDGLLKRIAELESEEYTLDEAQRLLKEAGVKNLTIGDEWVEVALSESDSVIASQLSVVVRAHVRLQSGRRESSRQATVRPPCR